MINIKNKRNKLILGKAHSGGRNNNGRITAYHLGNKFNKLKIRNVNFKSNYKNYSIIGESQRDPNRTAFIQKAKCLISDKKFYVLSPEPEFKIGYIIKHDLIKKDILLGYRSQLKNFALNTLVKN